MWYSKPHNRNSGGGRHLCVGSRSKLFQSGSSGGRPEWQTEAWNCSKQVGVNVPVYPLKGHMATAKLPGLKRNIYSPRCAHCSVTNQGERICLDPGRGWQVRCLKKECGLPGWWRRLVGIILWRRRRGGGWWNLSGKSLLTGRCRCSVLNRDTHSQHHAYSWN